MTSPLRTADNRIISFFRYDDRRQAFSRSQAADFETERIIIGDGFDAFGERPHLSPCQKQNLPSQQNRKNFSNKCKETRKIGSNRSKIYWRRRVARRNNAAQSDTPNGVRRLPCAQFNEDTHSMITGDDRAGIGSMKHLGKVGNTASGLRSVRASMAVMAPHTKRLFLLFRRATKFSRCGWISAAFFSPISYNTLIQSL